MGLTTNRNGLRHHAIISSHGEANQGRRFMTRENKLALIIGFSLILVVAILITDHLSPAQSDRMARLDNPASTQANNSSLTLRATLPSGGDQATGEKGRKPSSDYADNSPRSSVRHKEPPRIIPLQPGRSAAQIEEANAIEMGKPSSTRNGNTPTVKLPPSQNTTRIHIVQKGDSLYRIARKYYGNPSLARKLADFNHGRIMPGMNIRVGVTLRIPDLSILTGSTKLNNTPTPQTNANTNKPTQYTTYKIKPGDTLGEISLRLLGTSKRWHEIVNLNKNIIDDPDSIPVGKTIRIPPRKK